MPFPSGRSTTVSSRSASISPMSVIIVVPDTALDKEAYERATSVYLPDRVNPMLPERISNELCSLRPHEDKLTFSAIFRMTRKRRDQTPLDRPDRHPLQPPIYL